MPNSRSVAATAGCVVLALSTLVQAYPVHRRLYQVNYGKPVRCELCHAGGGGTERNPYGQAWQKRGESRKAFSVIEALDSDGDGFSNLKEIQQGSNPGSKRSVPSKPGRLWQRVQEIPIPTEQLQLVFGSIDRIEALEPELTAKQLVAVRKQLGASIAFEVQYPTVYFAVKDDKKVAVALFGQFRQKKHRFSLLVGIGLDGKVRKIAMFRAGPDQGTVYRGYLNCLEGYGKDHLPKAGQASCPRIKGKETITQQIAQTVKAALWTVAVLFAKN